MVEKSHTAGWWPQLYEPLRQVGERIADWFAPRSDASAMKEYYEINVELPGVKPENVDVSLNDNSLTVKGEKRTEREEKGRTYFFTEREYGSFQRTFRLPEDADAAKIDAAFNDGILCLRVAKKKPKKNQGRRIDIRQG